MDVCLKCGGTGVTATGESCECKAQQAVVLPTCTNIPVQYQGVRFDKGFLRAQLQSDYGVYMENLIRDITDRLYQFNKNIVICAPPNSGKTVFAYTVYGLLFAKGMSIPKLMDLMEVRAMFLDYYLEDKEELEKLNTAKIAIIKLPMDLPYKFPETMSTIIERRVRNNCSTIFLYSGSEEDLLAQDKFGKLKNIKGDGSYNSVQIKSWKL